MHTCTCTYNTLYMLTMTGYEVYSKDCKSNKTFDNSFLVMSSLKINPSPFSTGASSSSLSSLILHGISSTPPTMAIV